MCTFRPLCLARVLQTSSWCWWNGTRCWWRSGSGRSAGSCSPSPTWTRYSGTWEPWSWNRCVCLPASSVGSPALIPHSSPGFSILHFCQESSWNPFLLCTYNVCAQSCPTLGDPMDCSPPGSSVHGILPGKNTGVGCRFLLQGIFPTHSVCVYVYMCTNYIQTAVMPHKNTNKRFLRWETGVCDSAHVLCLRPRAAPRSTWCRGLGWLCPRSAVILTMDKFSHLILAGYCVTATGTTSPQVELDCLFTVTIWLGCFIILPVGIWVLIPRNQLQTGADEAVEDLVKLITPGALTELLVLLSLPTQLTSVQSPLLPWSLVFPSSCLNSAIKKLQAKLSWRRMCDFTWCVGANCVWSDPWRRVEMFRHDSQFPDLVLIRPGLTGLLCFLEPASLSHRWAQKQALHHSEPVSTEPYIS